MFAVRREGTMAACREIRVGVLTALTPALGHAQADALEQLLGRDSS